MPVYFARAGTDARKAGAASLPCGVGWDFSDVPGDLCSARSEQPNPRSRGAGTGTKPGLIRPSLAIATRHLQRGYAKASQRPRSGVTAGETAHFLRLTRAV